MLSVIYFLKGQRRPKYWEAEGEKKMKREGGGGGQPSPMNEENKRATSPNQKA